MKKIILSIVAIATLSINSFGQAPEAFKYQAVVRNASNTILTNQAVGLRMAIKQGSISGTTIYSESFSTTTSANGLVNVEIGNGTPISGTFANIDWANGPFFIETAIDATGGSIYVVMGASQLMSVPYALHSKTANYISNNTVELVSGNTYNNINVEGISVIYANLIPGTTNVEINGLSNGKKGQVIYIANIANPYNNGVNIIINSNNALGDQKFDSPMNGGTVYIWSGRGYACFFDGTLWRVMWTGM